MLEPLLVHLEPFLGSERELPQPFRGRLRLDPLGGAVLLQVVPPQDRLDAVDRPRQYRADKLERVA